MEKLECDLAQFVSTNPHIQLHMKLSILRDVTYGLVYLHEYNPPIIHRDLTAQNILLTKSYQAKIADVGVSKMMDETARKARSHTLAPGQIYYMPPEVCTANPLCTSKLDIFSFGQLCLHTLLGDYPKVYEVEVTAAMVQEGTVQKMRRLVSLDLIGSDHCLYPLITQCLMDNPDKRPTTREVNISLFSLAENHSKDVEVKELEIAQLLSKNEELSEKFLEQGQQLKKLQDKVTALKQINESLIANILELKSDMESMKIQHADGNRKLPAQHAEIEQYDRIFTKTEHPDIPVEEEDWYYGNISCKAAEYKCMTSGDYIVRYSEEESKYMLTCNWKGQRQHFIIQQTQENNGSVMYKFEVKLFPTIKALLKYHCETGTAITMSSGAVIIKPVPKHDKWSLSHEKVKMGNIVSEGTFSVLIEGFMNKKKVAVKLCNSTDPAKIEKFMMQWDILKQCDHPNIIGLLGVCSDEEPVFAVTEYIHGGSLLNFLKKKDRKQTKMVLCRMCAEVSKGMIYLESKSFIHRNLAACNCLVGDNGIKISGFKLSRVAEKGIYNSLEDEQISVKWTAPEAVKNGKFSFASDVWSFGILLWQIYSWGFPPYPGMNHQEALSLIESGYGMPQPADCPDEIYSIMKQCWRYDPKDRLNFNTIMSMLTELRRKNI